MYEDITNETFQADGEFWEAIQVPWDDYDDYFEKNGELFKFGELNTISLNESNEIYED